MISPLCLSLSFPRVALHGSDQEEKEEIKDELDRLDGNGNLRYYHESDYDDVDNLPTALNVSITW